MYYELLGTSRFDTTVAIMEKILELHLYTGHASVLSSLFPLLQDAIPISSEYKGNWSRFHKGNSK